MDEDFRIKLPRELQDGDVVFKSDADWWNNACINFAPGSWDLYAIGFKKAGDILVEHAKITGSDLDTIVYPAVFLYRQYVELRLKDLIIDGSKLLDEAKEPPPTHSLQHLWSYVKDLLNRVFSGGNYSEFEKLEAMINQFNEVDPSSFSFRYPVDKKGKITLPGISHINVRNLQDIMDGIYCILETCSVGIGEQLAFKREMESEFNGWNDY
jgi:HEPN domain-containing protein